MISLIWRYVIIIVLTVISFVLAEALRVEIWILWLAGLIFWAIVINSPELPFPEPYKSRGCAGRDWKRKFPKISNRDIRLFLTCFVDGMGFSEKNRLKFIPDDKMIDVYRSIYGGKTPFSDAMECETFLDDVASEFNVDQENLYSFCRENITLGEIFDFAINNRKFS